MKLVASVLASGANVVCDRDLCVAVLHADAEGKRLARLFAKAPAMAAELKKLKQRLKRRRP